MAGVVWKVTVFVPSALARTPAWGMLPIASWPAGTVTLRL
jgi:hypothetical protein